MPGHHTNHSLRASAATQLHQSGCVEEQEIMERIRHRSLEAVRSYKKSSNDQLQQVSDILNTGTTKRSCHGSTLVEASGDIITQNTSSCVSHWNTINLAQLSSIYPHLHL